MDFIRKNKLVALDITYIAVFTTLIAVCSWICIPIVVPFTMQTFAIFVTAGLLGAKRGVLSVLLYILLGLIGVPVFHGFSSGLGILLGSTGGYIISFIFIPLIVGAATKIWGKKTLVMSLSMLVGLIVCYTLGTIWFTATYMMSSGSIGVITVLSWCVIPFIIPDIAKIYLAVITINRVSKYVKMPASRE